MRVRNVQSAKTKLAARVADKKKKFEKGLAQASKFLLAKSDELVPVDYSHLKGSRFIMMEHEGGNIVFRIGYSASYAIYVHENTEALHGEHFNIFYAHEIELHPKQGPFRHSRGPEQRSKFLEIAVRRNRQAAQRIIRSWVTS